MKVVGWCHRFAAYSFEPYRTVLQPHHVLPPQHACTTHTHNLHCWLLPLSPYQVSRGQDKPDRFVLKDVSEWTRTKDGSYDVAVWPFHNQ